MGNAKINWAKLNILVVEDDENLREVIIEMFQSKSCKVSGAENGSVALSIVDRENIDIIFSDIRMPVMDGVEMLKNIKARNQEKPLIFLTTGHADIDEKEIKKLGAEGLFYKPFYCETLISTLEKLLLESKSCSWLQEKIS